MKRKNLVFANRGTKYAMAKQDVSEQADGRIGNDVKLALSCPTSGQGNAAILIGEERNMYAMCNNLDLEIPDGVECCVPPKPSKERLAQCNKADERIILEAQILTPETDEKAMRRVCALKNMECRFDDDDTPLQRGQCKPQYTHGGYQNKDGKRYKIKWELSCVTRIVKETRCQFRATSFHSGATCRPDQICQAVAKVRPYQAPQK